jgi:phosphoserine aminotransferase
MARAHNFSAGPAALPTPVLERARDELLDWHGVGASIMELSHRGKAFSSVIEAAEASLRRLLSISDDYAVLFVQGGASLQFSAVPLNLAAADQSADYVLTGQWSKKAFKEGQRLLDARLVASSESVNFTTVPEPGEWQTTTGAAYLHYCPNETIGGLEFAEVPSVDVPLVADMSSTILSRPINVDRFDVIYAGAQKNIGPAGLALVIVRKSLLDRARADIPALLSWRSLADQGSMLNTPPTLAIYLAGLVFEWLEEGGGLQAMEIVNRRKAQMLYQTIDSSGFYENPIDPRYRSLMNVPFVLADASLDATFLSESEAAGLLNLKGHRSVGGMRASLYNAVSEASVGALCDFMRDFEARYG